MFNENLKKLRKSNNLTQEQLAEKLNISRQALAKWESGETEPNIETTKQIAEIFDITVDKLIGNEKNNKNLTFKNKVNIISGFIIAFSLTILLTIILLPYFENISDTAMKAIIICLFIISGTLWIRDVILEKHYIKNNETIEQKELLKEKLPKDIFGRILDLKDSKKRYKIYFLDSLTYSTFFLILDIFTRNYETIIDLFINLGITIIIFFILDLILNEPKVKKYNKLK